MSNAEEKLNKLRAENSLSLNGEKVFLFGGEMHFWRIAPQYWGKCLRQLKEAGLKIVSTYVSWRKHNISPEENDLTGKTDPRLNLRHFLQLCAKLEIWVHLKPGPWICAEEQNGGYPEWLLQKEEILVRDNQGSLVKGYSSPFSHYVPSYLHPKYLFYVRKWITDVDLCIKDFCYPKGPIILIQVDNEPSMAFQDQMFKSDYNPVNIGFYQQWLQEKYSSIKELNSVYGTGYFEFSGIEPPFKLVLTRLQDLKKYMDWVEFKEWLLARHLTLIKEMHLHNGIKEVFFTTNYNQHRPMAVPNNWRKMEEATGLGGYDIYALEPLDYQTFADIVKAINYSRTVSRMPWAPEIMSGAWNIKESKDTATFSAQHLEFLYFIAIAYGLKGMNFYMFVNRENWSEAPLDETGEQNSTYPALQKVINFLNRVEYFPYLSKAQDLAILYYRPSAWEAYICSGEKINLENVPLGLVYRQFESLYRSLLRLNYDPAIFDPWVDKQAIFRYKLLFAPSPLYMDKETQQTLREYVEKGGILIFLPFIPQLNLKMETYSCFPFKISWVERLSTRQKHPSPWGIIWTSELISFLDSGLSLGEQKIGKGRIIFIGTYLPDQEEGTLNNNFLPSLLAYCHLRPEVETNNRYVNTIIQKYDDQQILFVINLNPKWVKVDLQFNHIKSGRLKDIFSSKKVFLLENRKVSLTLRGKSVDIFQILN